MAYDKADLEKQALAAIKEHKLVFLSEVVSYLPCSEATFYNHKLGELESIKKAIEQNRINEKVGLRKKWRQSDNPTVQIALYKLVSSEEEAHRLNGSKRELEVVDKTEYDDMTLEELREKRKYFERIASRAGAGEDSEIGSEEE